MLKTKKIIGLNVTKHDGFEGYYLLIEKIEKNVDINPDIAIESCKSLIEGISKFILTKVDITYSIKTTLEVPKLVKRMLKELGESFGEELDDDLVNRLVSVVIRISEIRNKRGDISHGKVYPKEENSGINSSNFILSITDELLFYILNIFFSIKFKRKIIEYDENQEFNNSLDEENSFGLVSYSQALYEQKPEEYLLQLSDYTRSNEEDIEGIEEKNIVDVKKKGKDKVCIIEKKVKKVKKIDNNKFNKFCKEEQIDNEKFEALLNNYIFSGIIPLNDEIAEVLNYKPSLLERNKILINIKNNLDSLLK